MSTGKLTCWTIGSNDYGQQGIPIQPKIQKLTAISLPNDVSKINNIISGRNGSTYIIYNDNRLIVCGYNEFGQLGLSIHILINHWNRISLSSMMIPMDVINLISSFFAQSITDDNIFKPMEVIYLKIKYISPGISSSHRLVITNDNQLYGIGSNDVQQLGFVCHNNDVYTFTEIRYFADRNIKLKAIHCGYSFSTFLTKSGEIYTSGASCRGFQRANKFDTTLAKVVGVTSKIIDICCGSDHTLALTQYGTVESWGYNTFGQLGHANQNRCFLPKVIQALKNASIVIKQMACGGWNNVLLDITGKVHCFGRNDRYQCGMESTYNNPINRGIWWGNGNYHRSDSVDRVLEPIVNDTLKRNKLEIIEIKCGLSHCVAKTKQNTYYLWGDNRFRQCLVFSNEKIVKIPTKFPKKGTRNNFIIQAIYPGYKETRVVTVTKK